MNHDPRSVTFPGKNGNNLAVLIEDVRLAIPHDSFTQTVQEGIYIMDNIFVELVSNTISQYTDSHDDKENLTATEKNDKNGPDADFTYISNHKLREISDRICVYCPDEHKFFPSIVHSSKPNFHLNVHSDDGEKECLGM